MNKNPPLIAVVCGLITALLFLAPLTLGGLGFVMSTFTAMPLFVAALGFGTVNAIIAGVVAAVAVSFFTGAQGAVIVGGATLLPAIWVGHMVGLFRDDDGTQEWFPISTILFRMALMCAVISIGFGATVGYSPEWAANQIETVLTQFANLQPETADAPILTPEQIKLRSVEAAGLIPIAMPMSLLVLMVINLLLAARFARKRGWILRPQVNLPLETAMPQIAVGVFALAIALSFLSGPVALIAQVLTGAMVGAFLLVGLATLHYLTIGTPIRGVFLGITYFALLASRTLAGVVALIGVGETLFQIRARRGDPNSSSKHF